MNAHLRYLRYVLRHKWFVFVAGLKTGAPLWRLVIHDWSKFLPSEWIPYADYFYGAPYRPSPMWGITERPNFAENERELNERREAAFDRAWLHHQHANPHHWQHWVLREDSGATKLLPMPENFIREMVADWCGAGRAITGRWEVREWYAKNRDRICIDTTTRLRVEQLLESSTPEIPSAVAPPEKKS